jgi:hypothetical protein
MARETALIFGRLLGLSFAGPQMLRAIVSATHRLVRPAWWYSSFTVPSVEFLDKFEKYLIQINMARFCLRIL